MKTKQLRDQMITLGVSLVFNILISWSLYFSAFNKHFLFWGLWVREHVKNHNIDNRKFEQIYYTFTTFMYLNWNQSTY